MGLVAVFIILALLFAGFGLLVEGLGWLLLVGLLMGAASVYSGYRASSRI